jgi:hypothetical protein
VQENLKWTSTDQCCILCFTNGNKRKNFEKSTSAKTQTESDPMEHLGVWNTGTETYTTLRKTMQFLPSCVKKTKLRKHIQLSRRVWGSIRANSRCQEKGALLQDVSHWVHESKLLLQAPLD